MNAETVTARSVVEALDRITGGRIPPPGTPMVAGSHPFVVKRTSGLAGKAVLETPGLVVGDPGKPIGSMGIAMTLTESVIELAGAMGLDAILTHHPVADAASAGGVPLRPYLDLYHLALFELHEAFHGLHPGIAYLHGHRVVECDIHFSGMPGNVVFFGHALPDVHTAGDILTRLAAFMDREAESRLLALEADIRGCANIRETTLAAPARILVGGVRAPVSRILHVFPHTGFTARHLGMALERFAQVDTVIVSISRVLPDSELAAVIRDRGLTLVAGNSHAQEIYENGLPLAYALQRELPRVDFVILKERITAVPLRHFGNRQIQQYARQMAARLGRPVQD